MIENAEITGTLLGIEDHGIMTFFVYVKMNGSGIGIGGYALDGSGGNGNPRVGTPKAIESIRRICEVVGVREWEDLKGKHCRVEHGGLGGKATRIGNIIENKWFDLPAFFGDTDENTD